MGINIVALQKAIKISNLTIDEDLAMDGHDITLDAGKTVDGKDVSGLGDMSKVVYDPDGRDKIPTDKIYSAGATGAVIDHVDIVDKELDYVVTEDDDGDSPTYVNVGTPYTVTKDDMDIKSGGIKVTLACEIHSVHSNYTTTVGYNIDGGGDVDIGTHNGTVYTPKSITDVLVEVGEIIQFRLKTDTSVGHIQKMKVTQTHCSRKTMIGYY